MKKEEFLNAEGVKVLIVVLTFAILISIRSSGYEFGQWLQRMLN